MKCGRAGNLVSFLSASPAIRHYARVYIFLCPCFGHSSSSTEGRNGLVDPSLWNPSCGQTGRRPSCFWHNRVLGKKEMGPWKPEGGNPAWAAGWVVSWRMECVNWDQRGGHEPAERRTKMGAGAGNSRPSKLRVVVVCMVLILTAPQTACDMSSSFCGLGCCPCSTAQPPTSSLCNHRAALQQPGNSTQGGPGDGAWNGPPSPVHIWEKFLSFAIIDSVPSLKRLSKSLSAPCNTGFLKVNFSLVSYHKKRGLEIV